MEIKSILKPEGSIMSGLAVTGLVYAVYQMHVGTVADAHVTEPNHPSLQSSKKKAGWEAFALVAAISLITRDGNVAVLGFGSIVAMELAYQHAISANPATQMMEAPIAELYQPAQHVYPAASQGASVDAGVLSYAG